MTSRHKLRLGSSRCCQGGPQTTAGNRPLPQHFPCHRNSSPHPPPRQEAPPSQPRGQRLLPGRNMTGHAGKLPAGACLLEALHGADARRSVGLHIRRHEEALGAVDHVGDLRCTHRREAAVGMGPQRAHCGAMGQARLSVCMRLLCCGPAPEHSAAHGSAEARGGSARREGTRVSPGRPAPAFIVPCVLLAPWLLNSCNAM